MGENLMSYSIFGGAEHFLRYTFCVNNNYLLDIFCVYSLMIIGIL